MLPDFNLFSFVGDLIKLTTAVWLIYWLPGLLVTSKFKFAQNNILARLAIGLIAGMVISTLLSFLLGLWGLRDLMYLVMGILAFWYLVTHKKNIINNFTKIRQLNFLKLIKQIAKLNIWTKLSLLVAVVGMVMALQFNWFFGRMENGRIHYCCSSIPDNIYHLSLAQELTQHIPPREPGMSDTVVSNYHYFANLTIANMARLTHINLIYLMMRFYPMLLLILLGLGYWFLASEWRVSRRGKFLLIVSVYFFGELTYLLRYLTTGVFSQSLQFHDNALALAVGPPRLFSVVIAVWAMYLIWHLLKKPQITLAITTSLLIASLAGFKIYTFMMIGGGLFLLNLWLFVTRKWPELKAIFLTSLLSLVLALVIYLSVSQWGSNSLVLTPPYNIHNFINHYQMGLVVLQQRLDVFKLYHNYPKILLYETGFILIYLTTMFGIFNLGFLGTLQKKLNHFRPLLYGVFGTALFLGIFSMQTAGGLNTNQFLMTLPYFLFLPTILFVDAILSRIKNKVVGTLIFFILIFLIANQSVFSYLHAWPINDSADDKYVSADEVAILQCIKQLPKDGLVAVDLERSRNHDNLYISLLSQQPMYLLGVYSIFYEHGVPTGMQRYADYQSIYTLDRPAKLLHTFLEHHVGYLFTNRKEAEILMYWQPTWQPVCAQGDWRVLKIL